MGSFIVPISKPLALRSLNLYLLICGGQEKCSWQYVYYTAVELYKLLHDRSVDLCTYVYDIWYNSKSSDIMLTSVTEMVGIPGVFFLFIFLLAKQFLF